MGKRKSPGRGKGYQAVLGMQITCNMVPTYVPAKEGANCIWTLLDIIELCNFLVPHLPAWGDRRKFKAGVYGDAADYLNARIIAGREKKKEGVRSKISDLLAIFDAVEHLKNHVSGIHWDDERGANITTPDEERMWETIVLSKPDCSPFKNSGWEVYDDVLKLHPEKSRG
ncbi:hypothetical protein K435DRAFT_624793, partial [Dendrothele bispora CBS 962.96]